LPRSSKWQRGTIHDGECTCISANLSTTQETYLFSAFQTASIAPRTCSILWTRTPAASSQGRSAPHSGPGASSAAVTSASAVPHSVRTIGIRAGCVATAWGDRRAIALCSRTFVLRLRAGGKTKPSQQDRGGNQQSGNLHNVLQFVRHPAALKNFCNARPYAATMERLRGCNPSIQASCFLKVTYGDTW
jgi:hypothetical protein